MLKVKLILCFSSFFLLRGGEIISFCLRACNDDSGGSKNNVENRDNMFCYC